jgi:hypothetical protein
MALAAVCHQPLSGSFPPAGFVIGSFPAHDTTNVTLATNRIRVYFNQPLSGFTTLTDFALISLDAAASIPLIAQTYNVFATEIYADITFDNQHPAWQPGHRYALIVMDTLRNACNTPQGTDIYITFRTGTASPFSSVTPTPTASVPPTN